MKINNYHSKHSVQSNSHRSIWQKIAIAAGAALLITAGVGITQHIRASHHQQMVFQNKQAAIDYNKRHFNQNVSIYHVPVGDLTIKQAVKKLNQSAKTKAVLTPTPAIIDHKPSAGYEATWQKQSGNLVSQKQVAAYFKKQYTKMPSRKVFKFKNFNDNALAQKLTRVANHKVKVKIENDNYIFTFDDLADGASLTANKQEVKLNMKKGFKDKVKKLVAKYDTLHKSYTVNLTGAKKMKVTNGNYGFNLDADKLASLIKKAIIGGQRTIDAKDVIYGEGFVQTGIGYGLSNHNLGNDYVLVSLKNQDLKVIKNNKVKVHLTNVVTGTAAKRNASGGSNATPTGVYYIGYKQSPSVLRGYNDDGSTYSSPVQYWMPFTVDGCGLHDASWRTDWSKSAYLYGGSHGCVNIQPSQIKSVWDNVKIHEPVIVY